MTYDHWKTTEPDDGYEPPEEDDGMDEYIQRLEAELAELKAQNARLRRVVDEAIADCQRMIDELRK